MRSPISLARDWMRPLKRRLEERRFHGVSRPCLAGRHQLPGLLNARQLLGMGAEIGVFDGWFSSYLLTYWCGEKLLSIDPWKAYGEEYQDDCNRDQAEMDKLCEGARELLRPHGSRSEIWRLTSREAAARLPDEALDFVYIDAQHHFEAVQEDLALWHPKVRSGGLVAGHDYLDGVFSYGRFGVKSAVDEFGRLHYLQIEVTGETESPSWFFFKP